MEKTEDVWLRDAVPGEWMLMQVEFSVPKSKFAASFQLGVAEQTEGERLTVTDAFAGIVPENWKKGEPIPKGAVNFIANPEFIISEGHAIPAGWNMMSQKIGRIAPAKKAGGEKIEGLSIEDSNILLYTSFPVQTGQRLVYSLRVKSTSPHPKTVRLSSEWRDMSTRNLGWKKHFLKQGDGKEGWLCKPCDYQIIHHYEGGFTVPFGLAQMDNGEVILLASWNPGEGSDGKERTVYSISRDRGDTWNEFEIIPDAYARPTMLAYLGKGRLMFSLDKRYFSNDYGRTWSERIPVQPAPNGRAMWSEGNPLVDRNAQGLAIRLAEIGFNYRSEDTWPEEPCDAFIRWSNDDGRTWNNPNKPDAWRWQIQYNGKTYTRSVCEGSLIRAGNGWLVAALRTDLHPRYFDCHNDNLCGTGVSVSTDEGRTWSPVKVLFEAGRMHAHLVRMSNGTLVMIYITRQDIREGILASYLRGSEAIISHDHGLTWDISRRYVLDEWPYYNRTDPFPDTGAPLGHTCSTLLDNGSILTAYGHYPTRGTVLIRWSIK